MITVRRFHHAGLIVSDLARARAFYEGLLGLAPSPARPALGFEGVWYDIGANQIHLLQVPNPYASVERPAHGGRDAHLALQVDDLEAVMTALDTAGIAYTRSRSGRNALFCRDPDGNALEFAQPG